MSEEFWKPNEKISRLLELLDENEREIKRLCSQTGMLEETFKIMREQKKEIYKHSKCKTYNAYKITCSKFGEHLMYCNFCRKHYN